MTDAARIPQPRPTRGKADKRLANGLVALSSAAIVAVYAAGYLRTAPAAATVAGTAPVQVASTSAPASQIAAAQLMPSATHTPAPATATATATASSSAQATTNRTATTTPTSQITAPTPAAPAARATATTTAPTATRAGQTTQTSTALRDGTYSGLGSSRHGSIQATVLIQNGKIVSAEITGCGTRYPCSKIALLPGQVIARQSASVDLISGATDSSVAYRSAVANALAQAR